MTKIIVFTAAILLAATCLYAQPGDVNIEGKLGVGTTTPQTRVDVNGAIKIGDTTLQCNATTEGALKYTNSTLSICIQNNWESVLLSNDGFDLVNGIHSSSQCENIGGTVVSDNGNDFCKFTTQTGTCPSGWAQYNNWSATSSNSCNWTTGNTCYYNGQSNQCAIGGGPLSCTTGSHGFENTSKETCAVTAVIGCLDNGYQYCSITGTTPLTCYADITEIGCY